MSSAIDLDLSSLSSDQSYPFPDQSSFRLFGSQRVGLDRLSRDIYIQLCREVGGYYDMRVIGKGTYSLAVGFPERILLFESV